MSYFAKVTDATSLGMHAMVFLAANPDSTFTTGEIASVLHASKAHLSKVLQRLARAGLVKSVSGPGGGYTPGIPPGGISLLMIYETIDGPFAPDDCLLSVRICGGKKCIFGGLLKDFNKQVRDYFKRTKLSDLTHIFRRKAVND